MLDKSVDISVVVPIYNVEEYLKECLDSLLDQGMVSLQIIMIDDGSTDAGGMIAKGYEDRYPNFEYYRIENGGLGHARNYGVKYAVGKYIAFVDSDDIVVEHTYEKMFILAEKNNSELTICNVARKKGRQITSSGLHKKIFDHVIDRTVHITEYNKLIYDTTSWNKLILRDFYLKNNFKFPEDILYEDIPVMISMHFMANRVSVLNSIGYLWRIRTGKTKSITQNNSEIGHVCDRLKAMEMLDAFMDNHVPDRNIHKLKQIKYLEMDIMFFIKECISVPDEQALEMLHMINAYISKFIDRELIGELSIINQQKYEYVIREDLPALKAVCEYQNSDYDYAPVIEKDRKLFVELPDDLFPLKRRDITQDLTQFEPRKYIDKLSVGAQGIIEVSAHLYWRRVNISDCAEQSIALFLLDEITGERIPIDFKYEKKKDLTEKHGKVMERGSGKIMQYNYDGTGFNFTLNLNRLQITKRQEGCYRVVVKYRNRFSEGDTFLSGYSDTNQNLTTVAADSQTVAKVYFACTGVLQIDIRKEEVFCRKIFLDEGNIHCILTGTVSTLWMKEKEGNSCIRFKYLNNREYYIEKECMECGSNYEVYIGDNEIEPVPLLCSERKLDIHENQELVVLSSSIGTSALCLRKQEYISWLKKIGQDQQKVTLHVATAGDTAMIPNHALAKLYIYDDIVKAPIVLAEGTTDDTGGGYNNHIYSQF